MWDLHVAIALERVTTDVKFGKRTPIGGRRDAQSVLVEISNVIGVQINASQVILAEKRVRLNGRYEIVVQ